VQTLTKAALPWQAPRPCVGTSGGGSFSRPLADAGLREEISSRTSPDISTGMPVVPTERKPT
jgi:hypothetical protein